MKRVSRVTTTKDLPLSKIMSMSRADLSKAVRVLASAGNKRIARMKKQNITTPATVYIKKHGGKFSTAGKNIYELREEFQRAKQFLESETSTIKGYRQWETKVADTLMKNTGIDYNSLTEVQKRKFWKTYAKLSEIDPSNVYKPEGKSGGDLFGTNYRNSMVDIYDAVKGGLKMKDIDNFVNDLNNRIYRESSRDLMSDANNPLKLGYNK